MMTREEKRLHHREAGKKYYRAHREKVLARVNKYYAEHREERKAYQREYGRKYRAENKEEYNRKRREYRRARRQIPEVRDRINARQRVRYRARKELKCAQ